MGRKKKKEGQAAGVSLEDLIDKETWGHPSRLNHHLDSTARVEKENKVRIHF